MRKTCIQDGRVFDGGPNQEYCSARCRKAASRGTPKAAPVQDGWERGDEMIVSTLHLEYRPDWLDQKGFGDPPA
jgi:hypothetical protein